MAGFGSLFMVAGKRYSELHTLGSEAGTRRSLVRYTDTYLRFVWSIAAAATVMSYSLWAFEQPHHRRAVARASRSCRSCSALLRYAVDIDAGTAAEPEDIIWRDRVLQVIGVRLAGRWSAWECSMADASAALPDRLGPHRADRRHGRRTPTPPSVAGAARATAGPRAGRPRPRPVLRRRRAERRRHRARLPTAGSAHDPPTPTAAPVVTVAAGTSLARPDALPAAARLFVPVTPGTRYVTVGGAVAADVHGKNHHRDGTFGEPRRVARPGHRRRRAAPIGPDGDPDLFWATVGGMGLTGVVTSRRRCRVLPVETGWVRVDTERIGDLGALMRADAGARRRRRPTPWPGSTPWPAAGRSAARC